jgi:hypothetical protein
VPDLTGLRKAHLVSPRRDFALLCARESKVQERSWGVNGKEVVELAWRGIHIGRANFLCKRMLR